MTYPRLTLTFNDDGTVDANLDKDIPANALLLGITTTLAGLIEENAHDDASHNRAIDIVIEKLSRSRPRNVWIDAKDVQRILGDGWLDGKTPVELVKEHRKGNSNE